MLPCDAAMRCEGKRGDARRAALGEERACVAKWQCESEAIFLTSRQACRIMGWHEPPRNAPQELWWNQDGHQRAELFSDETELRKYMRAICTSPAKVRQISVIEQNHHVQELKQRAGLHLLNKLKWHQIPRTVIASIIAYNSDKANEKQSDTPKEEACET